MPPQRTRDPQPALTPSLFDLLIESGIDPTEEAPDRRLLEELPAALEDFGTNPRTALVRWVRGRGEVFRAKAHARRAAEAAQNAVGVLAGLVEAQPILARLELLRDREPPTAFCRFGGQLRELSVHPDVELERLRGLQPWHYVLVHPEEPVITGVADEPELYQLAQGEVVELRRVDAADPRRAFISKHDHDECVVTLAPALRGLDLKPPLKLILHRDDDRWAIACVEASEQTSRFEMPIDSITTRLEDLAGVEEVVTPLIDDILTCILHHEVRDAFGLRPLRGALLYSYAPGTGKTSVVCALGAWLRDLGEILDFDVVLYTVRPNELKSSWHGGDARLVREELCGSLRARQERPRERPLLQIVAFDELDSLGVRVSGGGGPMLSAAQNDAVQALLAEMDGFDSHTSQGDGPPAHVLWIGLTNLPDGIDGALKRPGRFGDLVVEMPEPTIRSAEDVMAVYAARSAELPWLVEGEVQTGLAEEEVRRRFLRPALGRVFDQVVLRYSAEGNRIVEVTAGEVLANVHYMQAANQAKKLAAVRQVRGAGPPAVGFDDVLECLLDQATDAAGQLAADHAMLRRQLRVEGPLNRVAPVPREEIPTSGFLREAAAVRGV